jgi:hypothetical protein
LKISLLDHIFCDQLLGVPESLQGHAELLFIQQDKLDGWIVSCFDRLAKFGRAGDDLLIRVEMANTHMLDNNWHFRSGMEA